MSLAVAERTDTMTGDRRGSPSRSRVTERATGLVAARRERALAIGRGLADDVGDPDAFVAALRLGLVELADPDFQAGQRRVAPGLGPVHGVRTPLLAAVSRGFRDATRRDRPTSLLFLADRVLREPELEARWFAFRLLERTLAGEPERSWQLMRRAARTASDWVTVDSLARPYADGIRSEPYRWAELEQLVFSPSRWERRLVGSTVATLSHGRHRTSAAARDSIVEHGLGLLVDLMGDADPEVQKALSWALRSLAQIDRPRTEAMLVSETDLAVAGDDGHRAWVVRDSLTKLDETTAADLKRRLAGIRRRPGAPPTSRAAALAARFGALPEPSDHPEPPLI